MDSGGKAPRALLVPLMHHGHFGPFFNFVAQLVRNNVQFTMLCTQERADELNRRKADGEFGTLDVEFVGFFRDIVKQEHPGGPLTSMREDWESHIAHVSPSRFTCIISDMFPYFTQEYADEWRIPRYIFMPFASICVLYFVHGQKVCDGGWTFGNPDKRHQPLDLPGLEIFTPVQTPRTFGRSLLLDHLPIIARTTIAAAGVLINSFEEMGQTLESLRQQVQISATPGKTPCRVFAIGPTLLYPKLSSPSANSNSSSLEISDSIDWLDKQPQSSVLFICFGSIRALPDQAVLAIAKALESTGIPFLWALRIRPDSSKEEALPAGFEAATKGRGLILTCWVPQQQLLQHPSVGGFLSHCGWNSALESIAAGVPIAACPMYAEQGMNAKFLVSITKVAVEVQYRSDLGDFDSEAVAAAISVLMDEEKGAEMRKNVQNWRNVAYSAVGEGGSSHQDLQKFLTEISRAANS